MRFFSKLAIAPTVLSLFIWMIVPLAMTLYFSFFRYNLLYGDALSFIGFGNYSFFVSDPIFLDALINTLVMLFSILLITICGGVLLAVLLNEEFWGRNFVRVLIISPFFIMPTVSALLWKNLLMHPVSGLFTFMLSLLSLEAIDWLSNIPLFSIILMVSWQWMPFATLILLTSLQSLDREQKEASEMDGAGSIAYFFYIVIPHLGRSISVVILIETIFLLNIFAEIFVTTGGGPGSQSTNMAFLVYAQALLQFDIGGASAGGIITVILANIVAIFLIRTIGKTMDAQT